MELLEILQDVTRQIKLWEKEPVNAVQLHYLNWFRDLIIENPDADHIRSVLKEKKEDFKEMTVQRAWIEEFEKYFGGDADENQQSLRQDIAKEVGLSLEKLLKMEPRIETMDTAQLMDVLDLVQFVKLSNIKPEEVTQ